MEIVADSWPGVVLVELPRPTLGAAETVRFGLEALDKATLSRPCMLVDGDTFYTCDIVGKFRAVVNTKYAGASFVFKDTQTKPIYSYVTIPRYVHNDFSIENIVEKVKISDWANTGCYCFRNGNELLSYCSKIIDRGETQLSQDMKGEFYTSGVIKAMLDEADIPFEAIILNKNDMYVLGTPNQIVDFCHKWKSPQAYRFCFDIDNTLFTSPTIPGAYHTCKPIPRTINFLKQVHAAGHYIILGTARRMRTHGGNTGAVIADIGAVTLKSLEDAEIPYHEIHFGKPWAQFYIDDHGINAFTDLEKELGFYLPVKTPAIPSKYTVPPKGSIANIATQKDKQAIHRRTLLAVAFGTYAAVLTLLVLRGSMRSH
eukprot:CAMPEP_0197320112 /NCGR_PEP_ID=MMETSP0891-20130614/57727_1 /TAXON_ID=44058 ORGANISM="Aureoumbra lagunensis, Strain CCMP1510" /NCGR_SAMPLE_ID=MMETSP0891 /ASSEMBLY_ACC=CAM_ASM_000534 /LENGTH=370 /DNA_ID=CAMNT_0042811343 /DNA_START=227 /DNA_END=1339 /DNA_ORIENTATION=-